MRGERTNEHGTRNALLVHIRSNPGIDLKRLSRDLGIHEGTLRYHLDVLIRGEDIEMERAGSKFLYYPSGARPRRHQDTSGDLNVTANRILGLIKDTPGINKQQLFSQMGITKKELNVVIRDLKHKKIIWEVQDGHGFGYEYITEKRIIDEMLLDLVEMFLDERIDEAKFMELRARLIKKRANL